MLRFRTKVLLACCLLQAISLTPVQATAAALSQAAQEGLITASETAKILPATVFFRGISAAVQARNSGGVRFADGRLMLVALVDTSGYSTQVKEKYQAYFITESALLVGGHPLAPGAYGCGFLADNVFMVQDIGGHDLFTVPSQRDAELRRPTPLQITSTPGATGEYRLYAGRSYVGFKLASSR